MTEMHEDEPKRWKDDDEAPVRVRDVLRAAGAAPKMPDAVRAAVLAGLPASPAPGIGSGPGVGPGAGASAVKAAGVSPAVLAAGAMAAAIVVALVVWLARGEAPRQPDPAPSSIDPGVTATVAPSMTPPPIVPEVASARPAESAAPAPSAVVSAPRPRASSSAGAPSPAAAMPSAATAPSAAAPSGGDTLAEESAIIGRARGSLASNPSATLLAVDEHGRRFPRGELGSEREYLRISALRRLGRVDEAKAHAKSYLAKYPSSPQAPAVKSFLAEAP